MSDRKGLLFEMKQHIKNKYKNNTTQKVYRKHAEHFCDYIKESSYTANVVRTNRNLFCRSMQIPLWQRVCPPIRYTHI